jgi:hypothetical protein
MPRRPRVDDRIRQQFARRLKAAILTRYPSVSAFAKATKTDYTYIIAMCAGRRLCSLPVLYRLIVRGHLPTDVLFGPPQAHETGLIAILGLEPARHPYPPPSP